MPQQRQSAARTIKMIPFSYYVGLDVHRKSISFCLKRADGTMMKEGRMAATREADARSD